MNCHEPKRTLGNGTGNKFPRAEARGVLFPRPCLWLRDLLIAVLCGQVTLLRIAALLAGITQGAAPPKSAVVVVEGRSLYTSYVRRVVVAWIGAVTLGGGAEAAAFFQSAVVTSGPIWSNLHLRAARSKQTKPSQLHPLAVINLWKPLG